MSQKTLTRMDLAESTANLMKRMLPPLVERSPNAIFVLVTNTVDVITQICMKISGLPRNQIFGSGTVLDTSRLRFLVDVGLDYLTLSRGAATLSGGEAQRIRLATQIGSGLVGVLYVLDEPSIGLHQRDNDRLIATLRHLRDLGNSVLVVEHDEDTMRAADHIIDLGPGAGHDGGRVVFEGTPAQLVKAKDTLTGKHLAVYVGVDGRK